MAESSAQSQSPENSEPKQTTQLSGSFSFADVLKSGSMALMRTFRMDVMAVEPAQAEAEPEPLPVAQRLAVWGVALFALVIVGATVFTIIQAATKPPPEPGEQTPLIDQGR